jgi:hypothetical protein
MLRDYAVHPHRWRGSHIYYSSHKECRPGSVFVRQTRFSSDTLSGTESVDFLLFISWNLFRTVVGQIDKYYIFLFLPQCDFVAFPYVCARMFLVY